MIHEVEIGVHLLCWTNNISSNMTRILQKYVHKQPLKFQRLITANLNGLSLQASYSGAIISSFTFELLPPQLCVTESKFLFLFRICILALSPNPIKINFFMII